MLYSPRDVPADLMLLEFLFYFWWQIASSMRYPLPPGKVSTASRHYSETLPSRGVMLSVLCLRCYPEIFHLCFAGLNITADLALKKKK